MSVKPDVKIEVDERIRGTTARNCSIAVYTRDVSVEQMDRIRLALSKITSTPEVSAIATGKPTALDPRPFVRLRMSYNGEQVDSVEVERAVKSAF